MRVNSHFITREYEVNSVNFKINKRLTSINLSETYQREPSTRPPSFTHIDNCWY